MVQEIGLNEISETEGDDLEGPLRNTATQDGNPIDNDLEELYELTQEI